MKFVLISFLGILVFLALSLVVFIAASWAPERTVEDLKARWAPPPSIFLDAAGMHVHLRDEGPDDGKPPIVLLHGSGSSLHAWEGWARVLKSSRRVIRFDLPGFGLTGPTPDGHYSIERDIGVLMSILDKLGIGHCVLAGNSLGGAIAWRAALLHPSRVEKLILVDAGGYPFRSISQPIG